MDIENELKQGDDSMDFVNKKMLVIGAGVSGFAAAKLAARLGASVTLSDAKKEADIKYDLQPLRDCGVQLQCGEQDNALLDGVDTVLVSPAVPVAIPLVQEA